MEATFDVIDDNLDNCLTLMSNSDDFNLRAFARAIDAAKGNFAFRRVLRSKNDSVYQGVVDIDGNGAVKCIIRQTKSDLGVLAQINSEDGRKKYNLTLSNNKGSLKIVNKDHNSSNRVVSFSVGKKLFKGPCIVNVKTETGEPDERAL